MGARTFAAPVGMMSAVALLPGGLTQAHAMSPASSAQCPSDRVCLFDSTDFVGLLGFRVPNMGLADLSAANDNAMESWINRTYYSAAWYDDRGGQGTCNTMAPLSTKRDVGYFARNGASSMRTDHGCP